MQLMIRGSGEYTPVINGVVERLERPKFISGLYRSALTLAAVGVLAIGADDNDPQLGLERAAIVEQPEIAAPISSVPNETAELTTETIPATTTTEAPTTTSSTTTTLEIVDPVPTAPQEQNVVSIAAVEAVPGLDPTVEANIRGMNLSLAGYQAFLHNIDTSYFHPAQTYPEFDANRNGIPQMPTQHVTMHFTVSTYEGDGVNFPADQQDLSRLIRGLAVRGDNSVPANHACCAINATVLPDGRGALFAPVGAKLQHNPPYQGVELGIELISPAQVAISPTQYEGGAYFAIAMLAHQQMLGSQPLDQILKGHGELRDPYKAANPHSKLGVRDDFDQPVMIAFRQTVQTFLDANPGVTTIPVMLP